MNITIAALSVIPTVMALGWALTWLVAGLAWVVHRLCK